MLKEAIVRAGGAVLHLPLLDGNVGAAAGIGQKAIHLGLVLIIFFWTTWRRRTGSGTAG